MQFYLSLLKKCLKIPKMGNHKLLIDKQQYTVMVKRKTTNNNKQ